MHIPSFITFYNLVPRVFPRSPGNEVAPQSRYIYRVIMNDIYPLFWCNGCHWMAAPFKTRRARAVNHFLPGRLKKSGYMKNVSFRSVYDGELQLCMYLLCGCTFQAFYNSWKNHHSVDSAIRSSCNRFQMFLPTGCPDLSAICSMHLFRINCGNHWVF
jgi:hypothetical protein